VLPRGGLSRLDVEQIASPDKPAYVCYAIVIIVGLWVAYAKVSKLMASSPDRWGFLLTWFVFLAYAVVPVALFWLLDFTNALHDTSIFAALLVALGYRQILAGEVKGTVAPSQFSALWSPFETWANQVRDRIATKNKLRSDRSNDKLQRFLAETPDRVEELIALAYGKTEDQAQLDGLTKDLADIKAATKPAEITAEAFDCNKTRRKVARCLRAIRMVNPEDYGNDLYEAKLVTSKQYWFLLGNAEAYFWLGYGLLFISFLLLLLGGFFVTPHNQLTYHLWRFQKVNATELDHYRTHKFLASRINNAAVEKTTPFEVIEPLLGLLRYRDIDRKVAENILTLILEFRQPGLIERAVPALIDALRTENPDVRLRIHEALKNLRELAYEKPKPDDDLTKWVPSKNESSADIERQINKYRIWWSSASSPPVPAVSPSPSP
jgi:hypothetical protein